MNVGLNPGMTTWDGLEVTVRTFQDAVRGAGGDPSRLPIVLRVNGSIVDEPVEERQPLTGSVAQVLEDIPTLERIGVTEVFWSMEDVDPDKQIHALEQLLA
jgi:hypothetical protein